MAEIVPLAEAVCFVGIGLPSRAANLTTGGGVSRASSPTSACWSRATTVS
jgi:hypothetical protein